MRENPEYWAGHYDGTGSALKSLLHFSYSDRIRYYWNRPAARQAIASLFATLPEIRPSYSLLGQYFAPEVIERASQLDFGEHRLAKFACHRSNPIRVASLHVQFVIMRWIIPKAVYEKRRIRQQVALGVVGGTVTDLVPVSKIPANSKQEKWNSIVGPALLDIQVNGGGGVMLNNEPTREGVRKIAKAHNKLGTGRLLPTVITDTHNVMEKASHAVMSEINKNGVTGIHIEGPHINPARKEHTTLTIFALGTMTLSPFWKPCV